MTKKPRFSAPTGTAVAAVIALAALAGCSLDSNPESWAAAISEAKAQAEDLAANRDQIIADAKAFGSSAQQSVTDAVSSAQSSADEARAALESLNEKRATAQEEVDAAKQQLNDAKLKLDDLTSKLSGDELAAIEAERDKIMGSLDSLISQLEVQ